jgi:hypothetical protein
MLGGEFIPDWRGDGNVWESFRRTCHPSTQSRRLFGSVRGQGAPSTSQRVQGQGQGQGQGQRPLSYLPRRSAASHPDAEQNEDFTFATRPDDTFDFCAQPSARYQQGHYFSDWRTIRVLYPVFSPAKAQGFSDLLIPSHYYYSSTKKYTYGWDPKNMVIKDVDDSEVPWDQKMDDIFWRGATTGGGSSPRGFLTSYQRHRHVVLSHHVVSS